MKVLMLGWEFPPLYAGGVGTVCFELTKELCKRGDVELTYVMPSRPGDEEAHVRMLILNDLVDDSRIKIKKINSTLGLYMTEEEYEQSMDKMGKQSNRKKDNTLSLYGKNILEEVYRYCEKINLLAEHEEFDVIHSHDWTTLPAAMKLKKKTGKPLVIHVHITEFDKSGGLGANPEIYAIERAGMHAADKVIAISHRVKNMIMEKYGVPEEKIEVVHNARINMDQSIEYRSPLQDNNKIVLMAGRVTRQKGPEFFMEAAKKVVPHYPNVKFIVIGSGEMLPVMIDMAADFGIQDKFIFHGFYSRDEAERFFSMADVYVMPSVSEPFCVVPLELMMKGTPTIISKQSGCSEVLQNTLKVDFWDTDEIANKIINVLKYDSLHHELKYNGLEEIDKLTWEKPAEQCVNIYKEVLGW